jgi:hypothetical protein
MWFNAPIPRFGHRRPRSRLHALPMKFPSELDWAAMTIARYMLFRERHIYLTAISGTLRLQFCFILYRRVRIRPARAEVTYKFLDVMYVPDIAPSQVVRFNVSLYIARTNRYKRISLSRAGSRHTRCLENLQILVRHVSSSLPLVVSPVNADLSPAKWGKR